MILKMILKIKSFWLNSTQKNMILLAAGFLVFSYGLSLLNQQKSNSTAPLNHSDSKSLDTYIPNGFSLVPITVQDYENLDRILGPYGVVDLFLVKSESARKPRLIARNIRIFRAPENPRSFAVLAPDDQVHNLVGPDYRFSVIVRSSKSGGTVFVKEGPRKRKIIMEKIL